MTKKNFPLYVRRSNAVKAAGEIFAHYKGGIYRVISSDAIFTEEELVSESVNPVVVYEYLWPHQHAVYVRPASMFYGDLPNGSKRFTPIVDGIDPFEGMLPDIY